MRPTQKRSAAMILGGAPARFGSVSLSQRRHTSVEKRLVSRPHDGTSHLHVDGRLVYGHELAQIENLRAARGGVLSAASRGPSARAVAMAAITTHRLLKSQLLHALIARHEVGEGRGPLVQSGADFGSTFVAEGTPKLDEPCEEHTPVRASGLAAVCGSLCPPARCEAPHPPNPGIPSRRHGTHRFAGLRAASQPAPRPPLPSPPRRSCCAARPAPWSSSTRKTAWARPQ